MKKKSLLNNLDEHQKFLIQLPKIVQKIEYFKTLYSPKEFNNELFYAISQAYTHIYLVALYLEHDQGGKKVFDALLRIKKIRPTIKIKILVDWHRAQRNRINHIPAQYTNIDWYHYIIKKYSDTDISIYRIPININEILGVLHLKGFIIDDQILYSGANLNNEYLHIHKKYRYDRYHIIRNPLLSNIMLNYIEKELLSSKITNKIKYEDSLKKTNKKRKHILLFRKKLRTAHYQFQNNANYNEFSITPLVGLGKNNLLNQTIYHLICTTKHKIIICTPYFNITNILKHTLIQLLHTGKNIEIIVGDKIANDFYIPAHKPFKLISILPYLYEMNLRYFLKQLQQYIDNKQLIIRLWKNGNNGYHIKGIWIDEEWQLLTGNNFNPRSLKFDLENALLIHDPTKLLFLQKYQELNTIRSNTNIITHYTSLQDISSYPIKTKKLIYKIHKTKLNLIINRIL